MRLLFSALLASLIITSLPASNSNALPQSSPATPPISGTVQDATGAVVPGAVLELQRDGRTIYSTLTDADGNFRFDSVPPGNYKIAASKQGFQAATVRAHAGPLPAAPLKIVMQIASIHEQVVVKASPAHVEPDTGANQNAVSVSSEALGNLPVFDQDVVATMSRFLESGETATSGAALIVDGMEVNDLGVTPSAIQEVKIDKNPYDAEFQHPGWGRIEITTKPGGTEYHGEFNFIFRDARLNARNAFAQVRPPEQRRIFEGSLSGPIHHSKRTHFFLSADHDAEDLQSIVFALGPQGAINQNVLSPTRNTVFSGKIDHEISDTNSFWIRYSHQDRTRNNQGVGGLTLPESGYNNEFREDQIRYNQHTVLSAKLLNQFRFLLGQYWAPTTSLNPGPQVVVLGSFTGGGAQADQLRTEHHFALMEILSYASGKHVLKTGFHVPDWSRRGLDNRQNTAGTFQFATLSDYTNYRPFSYTVQRGDGHLVFVEKVLGSFIQDDYRLRPNLMISAGLRYDWQNYFHDNNNFAPRLAFAYSPGKSSKTVIRGGGGVFYDRTGPGPIFNLLLFNGGRLQQYLLTNPGYPDPLSNGQTLTQLPVNITELDPRISIPYMIHAGVGVERQLGKSTLLSIDYHHGHRVHVFRSRDVNAPLPPLYAVRPDPALGRVTQYEAAGLWDHDHLTFTLHGNVSRYFAGQAQYSLQRARDNTDGIYSFPANQYDLTGEWGRSSEDRRHRFELLGSINPGKLFTLGVSVSVYSARPYTETTGLDPFHLGFANARPAGVPRNSLNGPGFADLDLRWAHDFHLKKDKGPVWTVALDGFNVLNHVNYDQFIGDLRSPFFAHAVSAEPARRLQLTMRFRF